MGCKKCGHVSVMHCLSDRINDWRLKYSLSGSDVFILISYLFCSCCSVRLLLCECLCTLGGT